jgi:hypothetical protein
MLQCFAVSLELHMPITQLLAELPEQVIMGYAAYFAIVDRMRKKAMGQ